MRTINQIKATKRNFMILYLTGVITCLKRANVSISDYYVKGHLNVVINSITHLLDAIRKVNYKESFIANPQKDVKYDGSRCNP